MYNKQVTQSDGVKQNVLTNTTTMRTMKEAIYINAFAPGEGNFGCLMNNDLGSHIDPIWKAISSVIQDSVKRKDV